MDYPMLSLVCFLFVLMHSVGGSLKLDVNPTEISLEHTDALTINCSFTFAGVTSMSGIIALIVSKSVANTTQFIDLISINAFSPDKVTRLPGVSGTVSAHMDINGESYLSLVWPHPTANQTGQYRCQANGVDSRGHPTHMLTTQLVTPQQPNLDQLVDKVSQLQDQVDRQCNCNLAKNQTSEIYKLLTLSKNQSDEITMLQSRLQYQENLTKNQSSEINTLSNLAKNQSNEINTLSTLAKNQSNEINTLSTLAKNQSNEINTLSILAKNQSNEITLLQSEIKSQQNLAKIRSDEINTLSTLSQNQSDQINKLLSVTKIQSQIISAQQSQLDNLENNITYIQNYLTSRNPLNIIMNTGNDTFSFHSEMYYNHYYQLSKQDWKDSKVAAKTCQDDGGYLAQINSNGEYNFVKDFLNQQTGSRTVLISGTDSQHEGRWTYTDTDIDLVFYDWGLGTPDSDLSHNCIAMYRSSTWRWFDYPCAHNSTNWKFLCEFEDV